MEAGEGFDVASRARALVTGAKPEMDVNGYTTISSSGGTVDPTPAAAMADLRADGSGTIG